MRTGRWNGWVLLGLLLLVLRYHAGVRERWILHHRAVVGEMRWSTEAGHQLVLGRLRASNVHIWRHDLLSTGHGHMVGAMDLRLLVVMLLVLRMVLMLVWLHPNHLGTWHRRLQLTKLSSHVSLGVDAHLHLAWLVHDTHLTDAGLEIGLRSDAADDAALLLAHHIWGELELVWAAWWAA